MRLWREEGLRVPPRKRKLQRLGESTVPAKRLRAERPKHVWALGFQFDTSSDGPLKLPTASTSTRRTLARQDRPPPTAPQANSVMKITL